MSLKIIFMGTSSFSIPTLNFLIKNQYNIVQVYSQPSKKSNRGQKINFSPVHKFAQENNLQTRTPERLDDDKEYSFINNLSADLAVVVAYGQLIPKRFLETTKLGFFNIHASLLPKWRGAAPIQRSIMNRDKRTGVCIMKIEEKLDAGPVLSSLELMLNPQTTSGELEKKLSEAGGNLLIEVLPKIINGTAKFLQQDHSKATYAKKISKAECKINWNSDMDQIVYKIHALNPKPGAWFEYKKQRFKVWKAIKSSTSGKPGTILDENLTVACKSGSIQILEIQREGKNKQQTKDFLLGTKISKNSILI